MPDCGRQAADASRRNPRRLRVSVQAWLAFALVLLVPAHAFQSIRLLSQHPTAPRMAASDLATDVGDRQGPLGWLRNLGGPPTTEALLRKYAPFVDLRQDGFNRTQLIEFYSRRPQMVAGRLARITSSLDRLKKEWDAQEAWPAKKRTRGAIVRDELCKLGPCFVKIGQTLSQRPDIVGDEAADELKTLQTANTPFSSDLAWSIIANDFQWKGPIAPGVVAEGCDPDGEPLLAWITKDCVASASLGQVYKARTHDGLEVAVKVQRPEATMQISLDWTCLALGLEALRTLWSMRPSGFSVDLGLIADEVAQGVFQELDYKQEARNAAKFKKSLDFLGFVDVPTWVPELTRSSVLTTEWVQGNHLDKLTPEQQLSMTNMAVEACTASLVLTGYVHADPHEGNLMLGNNGRLYFLDFGLMSKVEGEIMEFFATGIQACLAEDYYTLAQVFQGVGFIGTPLQYRDNVSMPFVDERMETFAEVLQASMQAEADGTSRFGALATVLSSLGDQWRMYTPPYVLLLIRTFLTLEGIAAKVDPDFNIYEVSLPWAIKRSLSPASETGVKTLRAALLTQDGKLQLDRFQQIMVDAAKSDTANEPASSADEHTASNVNVSSEQARLAASVRVDSATVAHSQPEHAPADHSAATASAGMSGGNSNNRGLDAIKSLIGTPEGAPLRRIVAEVDSTSTALDLLSSRNRELRRLCVKLLAEQLKTPTEDAQSTEAASSDTRTALTPEFEALVAKQQHRSKRALQALLSIHWKKTTAAGLKGLLALSSLALVSLRVVVAAAIKAGVRNSLSRVMQAWRRRRAGGEEEDPSKDASQPAVA